MAELTAEGRFWTRVRKTDTCWVWIGSITEKGYGNMPLGRRAAKCYAHRWAYEHFIGPIPEGTEVDHACHDPNVCMRYNDCPHRRCVNPSHLRAVTHLDNVQNSNAGRPRAEQQKAKTHCPQGHEYTPENTRVYWNNTYWNRVCRTCQRDAMRRCRARKASMLAPSRSP